MELAQCYCEYALSGELESVVEKRSILQKALNVSPTSVRASMLLADLEMADKNYRQAIHFLENILNQNPIYIGEVLKTLKYCYDELGERDNFELFLIRASQQINNTKVDLM